MKDTVRNGRVGSALMIAVVLSACLALFSIWLGLRLHSLRGDLSEAMEANDVLRRQLSMATDTVADVSVRLGTLRQQMDIAPSTVDTAALDVVPGETEAKLTALLEQLHRDGQALTEDAADPRTGVVRRRVTEHRRALAELIESDRAAVVKVLSRRTGYPEGELLLLLDALQSAKPPPDAHSVQKGLVRSKDTEAPSSDD